jgi:peroxiredoxin
MRRLCLFFPVLVLSVLFAGCQETPEELLARAKNNIKTGKILKYRSETFWQNPYLADSLNELTYLDNIFQLQKDNPLGYEYRSTGEDYDVLFEHDDYVLVNHKAKVLKQYPDLDKNDHRAFLDRVAGTVTEYSPLNHLSKSDWKYSRDTILMEKNISVFSRIDRDTVYKDLRVLVKHYLFIDQVDALVIRFERKLFNDSDKVQQLIYFNYLDIELDGDLPISAYEAPVGYQTRIGDHVPLKLLTAGASAPNFSLPALNGDTVTLADLRGKKVMLDFSVINCGFCAAALKHINRTDFALDPDVTWLYINPADTREAMQAYSTKMQIPFDVLLEANETRKSYGVSGFPTFFLIDEKGVIEEVKVGYGEESFAKFAGAKPG